MYTFQKVIMKLFHEKLGFLAFSLVNKIPWSKSKSETPLHYNTEIGTLHHLYILLDHQKCNCIIFIDTVCIETGNYFESLMAMCH